MCLCRVTRRYEEPRPCALPKWKVVEKNGERYEGLFYKFRNECGCEVSRKVGEWIEAFASEECFVGNGKKPKSYRLGIHVFNRQRDALALMEALRKVERPRELRVVKVQGEGLLATGFGLWSSLTHRHSQSVFLRVKIIEEVTQNS